MTKHATPHKWKTIIKQNLGIVGKVLIQDHHLIKEARILTLEKLSSEELYSILITNLTNKPSSNVYFEKIFPHMKFDWRKIYMLPRITRIYYLHVLLTRIYAPSNTKFSITFCFWVRNYLFFEWKIYHYVLSVIKKKRNRCISLVNIPLWFTFGNS